MKKKQIENAENVAYLFAVEHKQPAEIASLLDMSVISVWRYLKIARGRDPKFKLPRPLIKEPAPVLDVREHERKRIHANVIAHARAGALFPDLLQRLNTIFPPRAGQPNLLGGVSVFRSTEGAALADDHGAWDQAVAAFGLGAAPRVAELLRPARVIGISWGRTLQAITGALAGLNITPRVVARRATAFPVCGDVFAGARTQDFSKVFPDPIRLSPSFLAAQLATALNGSPEGTPSLIASRLLSRSSIKKENSAVAPRHRSSKSFWLASTDTSRFLAQSRLPRQTNDILSPRILAWPAMANH